jgi:hypothetical protein
MQRFGSVGDAALYDEVKQLSSRSAALHLYDHARRMMDRSDMAHRQP